MTLLLLLAGLAGLVVGAELLVRGASRLALAAGLSPLAVGLTVVAYGTSAPELAVSASAAVAGDGDLAFGNVVGSNIFNVLFILGASALIAPLVVARQLVRLDVPLALGVALLGAALALDGKVGRVDGLLLLGGLAAYTAFTLRMARRESAGDAAAAGAPPPAGAAAAVRSIALVLAGLALLVAGSRAFVSAASDIARALGVSELVVGLTIVAAGTSLPEVATSILAAVRGERDIAAGNVIGSNLFNILGVLGLSSALAPDGVAASAAAMRFDVPVMLAAAAACLPIFATGHRIDRWEGGLFLVYYGVYVTWLILRASQHDALPAFSGVMLGFVVPLTALTLVIVAAREWRGRRSRR